MSSDTTSDESTATFAEDSEHAITRNLPMSHLSIEVGHFYMRDLDDGEQRIRAQFQRIAPWVRAAQAAVVSGRSTPRISTCFLVDDYFLHDSKPAEILGMLLPLADEAGLSIDYIAREAACAKSGDIEVAQLVAARLQAEPTPRTNGSRPPTEESGWLCNGERSVGSDTVEAMQRRAWRQAQEFGRREHSIFADVELWNDTKDAVDGQPIKQRLWSCPFLASVWQLLRLGLLRHHGEPVAVPVPWWDADRAWPEHWGELPTVIQLNERAKPFSAFRAVSIMPQSYLAIENAVRMIIEHVQIDADVLAATEMLADREQLRLPELITERITHVFVEGR